MKVLSLFLLICAALPAHAADERAKFRAMCNSIASNTSAFADERKKGYTKDQMKSNARQIANQRELDKSVLEAWYAEIDWVFKQTNRRYGSAASQDRRFEECMKQYED